MNDLKGRISSLKLKAQEDHLRRRSMQSLREPSPFTSSETWHSENTAKTAGLGITTEPYDEQERPLTATTTTSQKHGEKLVAHFSNQQHEASGHAYSVQPYDEPEVEATDPEAYEDEDADETEETDFVSVNGDDAEPGPESVYEDAVYEMPVTERHEDRVDAFDYETFFLHSAMGTYSVEDRRSSTSSGTSIATTRPVTAVHTADEVSSVEKRASYHQRNPSVDSVSTVATFATAAEEQTDDDEENEHMDHFSQQILSNQNRSLSRPGTQNGLLSLRADSAINMRRGNASSPSQRSLSRGSSSPGELASGLQTSRIYSILTEGSRDEPRVALSEEETQLIYGLAASIQNVCSNLQHTYGDAYERKAWRRRLDEARKILNGEDGEEDQSF
jgi:hypothetical protein